MKKEIVTQYFLYLKDDSGDRVINYDKDKKTIFDLYQQYCEENLDKNYYIDRVQSIRELVASSNDVRQSLFSFS